MMGPLKLASNLLILLLVVLQISAEGSVSKVYIVTVTGTPYALAARTNAALRSIQSRAAFRQRAVARHDGILEGMLGRSGAARAKLYSYTGVHNGFSAALTAAQAALLRGQEGVQQVVEDCVRRPQTTRSYSFLGLDAPRGGAWATSNGSDVIIGLLDTGVWPESASFRDAGYGPPPMRWKGTCQPGFAFIPANCNNKLIGARFYADGFERYRNVSLNSAASSVRFGEYRSPRDAQGHGTHTASTAAGSVASPATFLGSNYGTARPVAYGARIAMYKVCWGHGSVATCCDSDILAALDDAVADGVDIVSLSLAGRPPDPVFAEDAVAMGTLVATLAGVTAVAVGGNAGPGPMSVVNAAPWILTVAAHTIDRRFVATVALASKAKYMGVSLTSGTMPAGAQLPIIPGDKGALWWKDAGLALLCQDSFLDPAKVKGKIVLCQCQDPHIAIFKSLEVQRAGGAGLILYNTPSRGDFIDTSAAPHVVPTVHLSYSAGARLHASILNQTNGTGSIGSASAQPDIAAPGDHILASWSESPYAGGPTSMTSDKRVVSWNVLSGTSMAAPHVAAVAALVKAKYRSWDPSWIRSAIITSGTIINNKGKRITSLTGVPGTPFDYGGGRVVPSGALDPGLVYGLTPVDYFNFLCTPSGHFTTALLKSALGVNRTCPTVPTNELDLNYPSIGIFNVPVGTTSRLFRRTVTLVGPVGTYNATIVHPFGASVMLNRYTHKFVKVFETFTFSVRVRTTKASSSDPNGVHVPNTGSFSFGSITWSDGKRKVRSPLYVNAV
eukprot:jgi/Mesen1/8420/ME000472S07786